MAGEASVEHAAGGGGATPCVRVARVAPGVVALLPVDFAVRIGDDRPGAEMIICQRRFHCPFSLR